MLFLDFPFLRYMYNNMYGGHWGDHRRRRFGDFRSQSFCQVTASGSRQGAFMECQTCYNLYGCCSLNFFDLRKHSPIKRAGMFVGVLKVRLLYLYLFFLTNDASKLRIGNHTCFLCISRNCLLANHGSVSSFLS